MEDDRLGETLGETRSSDCGPVTMSLKRSHSQRIPFDAKKIRKIDHCFSQADETQQNHPSLPQTSMNSTKCPKDGTDVQAQGPTEQPVSPTKTMNVTLKGDHRAYVGTYSEWGSLHEALTSLQAVREKIETQKGNEMLVQGIESTEGYINLGIPLSCFNENCCLEITFTQSGSEQKIENQEFVGCPKVSNKCLKFYIDAVGKELRRILISCCLHKKGCKLCIYAFKEETIRQALCRDGRLRPFLESGDWKLIENGNTILENTQLVGDLEGRIFEVELEKRKLPRASMTENSESEKKNPTLLDEEIVKQNPHLKRVIEEIISTTKKIVEVSKGIPSLSKSYETDFENLTQNSTPITDHRLLAPLADSVGCIEWYHNGKRRFATCFIFCGPYICTCRRILSPKKGEGGELHNWVSIVSQSARVTFDYEDPWKEENKYFSIDPSFLLSNEKLDYAVLRLKENGQVPLGLYHANASVQVNELIHIIGHPSGEIKRSNAGLVIPQSQREEEYRKCVQARKAEGRQSDHLFIPESFQELFSNPDMISYNTSSYHGSSGSPVFNSSGALVAMHCRGTPYHKGDSSVIGFGVSVKSILLHIAQTEAGKDWLKELKSFANNDWLGEDAEMADTTQQNHPSLSQTSMNSTKCPKDVTDLQAQGPTEQLVPPTKTMNVTLKGDHRAHVVTYNERGSLYEALTSLQAVKEKMETQKGKEMLVRGTEGIEGYINLGMPLSCFPENCHLEITFAQSGSKQKIERQGFVGRSKESSKYVKFYIHAVGKELIRIVKSKHLHRKGCKLCICAFQEETVRQALCRDGRLLPFLESGDWRLFENGDTILENTQLVGDLEGRVFEVELEKSKLTRASVDENSESEKRKPTPLAEGTVEQQPCLRRVIEEIIPTTKQIVEISKEITLLSNFYGTDFENLPQNSTPVTEHRLLAPLANSVGCIEWNKNGIGGSATCFVLSGSLICTCRHLLRKMVGDSVEPHNWIHMISQKARVTFDYENSSRGNHRYFSIDPSFLLSNEELDYAVLSLKEDGQVPLGLQLRSVPVPLTGLVHIIGHPKGERKRSDTGVVIPQSQQEEEYRKCLQARKAKGCPFEHILISKLFQEIANNPDVITYHTSLSFGSSGSPVFDSSGAVVAMHLGSLDQNGEPAIGFGVSLKSIVFDIIGMETGR